MHTSYQFKLPKLKNASNLMKVIFLSLLLNPILHDKTESNCCVCTTQQSPKLPFRCPDEGLNTIAN